MNPNVLVTGGAGYIGSHVCKAFAQAGYTPVSIDNLSTGHRASVLWGPLEVVDLRDTEKVSQVFSDYNPICVMHLAGKAYVADSILNPLDYFSANIEGSISLFRALLRHKTIPVVFSSSCTVYGNVADGTATPKNETEHLSPINPYGDSKLAVERLLAACGEAYGLPWISLRFFNAAGADPDGDIGELHDPEPHLIPTLLNAAYTSSKDFQIFGSDYPTKDGTCIRDFIHVSDLATAHVCALDRLLKGPTSFSTNLGSGRGWSILDVIAEVERITNKTIAVKYAPRRPGDAAIAVADTSKLEEKLSFSPKFTLTDMIETADSWYRKNAT